MIERYLRTLFLTVLFLFSTTTLCLSDDTGDVPHIVKNMNGQISLHLPDNMATALTKFDPEFVIREMSSYPEWFTERYQYDRFYAPFAIIGDFNGDNILDVLLDGDSLALNRTIALMSNKGPIEILVVRDKKLPVTLEADLKRGRKEPYHSERINLGVVFYKETPENFDLKTKEILRLINDGFTVWCFR